MRAAGEIVAGRIAPAPSDVSKCRFCDLKDVCRYCGCGIGDCGGRLSGFHTPATPGDRHLEGRAGYLRGGGARVRKDARAGGALPQAGGSRCSAAAHSGHHVHRESRAQHEGAARRGFPHHAGAQARAGASEYLHHSRLLRAAAAGKFCCSGDRPGVSRPGCASVNHHATPDGAGSSRPDVGRGARADAAVDAGLSRPRIWQEIFQKCTMPSAQRAFRPSNCAAFPCVEEQISDSSETLWARSSNEKPLGWNVPQIGRLREVVESAARLASLPDGPATAEHFRVIDEFPTSLKGIKQRHSHPQPAADDQGRDRSRPLPDSDYRVLFARTRNAHRHHRML